MILPRRPLDTPATIARRARPAPDGVSPRPGRRPSRWHLGARFAAADRLLISADLVHPVEPGVQHQQTEQLEKDRGGGGRHTEAPCAERGEVYLPTTPGDVAHRLNQTPPRAGASGPRRRRRLQQPSEALPCAPLTWRLDRVTADDIGGVGWWIAPQRLGAVVEIEGIEALGVAVQGLDDVRRMEVRPDSTEHFQRVAHSPPGLRPQDAGTVGRVIQCPWVGRAGLESDDEGDQ